MVDITSFALLRPGRDIWIGLSDSPSHVLVTGIVGDTVSMKTLPIYRGDKAIEIQANTYIVHARKGTRTRVETLDRFLGTERAAAMPEAQRAWVELEINRMKAILAGESVPTKDETDFLHMSVQVKVLDVEGDPWTYLDALTGGCCNSLNPDTGVYEVSVIGVDELVRMQGNPCIEVLRYDLTSSLYT